MKVANKNGVSSTVDVIELHGYCKYSLGLIRLTLDECDVTYTLTGHATPL
jgi:hypothetical protein